MSAVVIAASGMRRVPVGLALMAAIAAGGCGAGGVGKAANHGRRDTRRMVPSYRVGQYCTGGERSANAHLAAGLHCERHHLTR